MKRNSRCWAALFTAGLISAMAAIAADQPAVRATGNAAGGGQQGNRGFQGRGGMMGLDEQQRQAFQEAVQKDSDKLRELEQKLRAAQKELLTAVLAENYEEKVVQTKAEVVAKIQVEITMLRAKALAAVAPTLKAEQKTQMIESPFGVMMLSGGFGGGRGGMGGPGMGGPGMGGAGMGGPGAGGPPAGGQNQPQKER